jgi:prefoldin subunit 5
MDLNATIKELDEMSKGLQQDIEEKDRRILTLNDENLALIKDIEYFKNQIENLKGIEKN